MEEITLFLAAWGAILSTILGVREFTKDRRSLKIFLEHVIWTEIKRIRIVNNGHRPVTIEQIFLEVRIKKLGPSDPMPQNAFWSDEDDHKPPEFPLTLEDGKMALFYVSRFVNEELEHPDRYLKIVVYDAEGNVYTKYKETSFDYKYGYKGGKLKPPSKLRIALERLRFIFRK